MNRCLRIGLVFLFALSTASATAGNDAADALQRLVDDSWEFGLKESPLFATRIGDHRFNDRLPSESIADRRRRLDANRGFLKRWEAIDRGALSRQQQINYDIFGRLLKDDIVEGDLEMYLIPITNRWGFHISFPELPDRVPLRTVADYENYISRLRQFARYTDDHIELLRGGVEKQLVLPAVVLHDYERTITSHIVDDPEQSLLYAPFEKFPSTLADDDRARLRAAGRQAINESIVPAYRKFLQFMESEYLPAARGSIGASALPRGREFYRHRVKKYTTLDITPEEVHRIGLEEVKRIRGEMDEVIRESGFEGDFKAFVEFLRTDDQFYAETPEQLLKEVAFTMKKMEGKLPELFGKLPRAPCGIKEVPAYIAPSTTTAYYSSPAGDGSRAGFYYVNTYNLRSRPLYEIDALSLHEAVPGHHLQLALQQELGELPQFRRFAGFTAFVEGWALYAERLGLEVGFYEDPYRNFGRLSYEMWRACRLVVDTGMHYLGWTRKQAINFMAENTSLSMHNIQSEVDRYISWPGQALAYKIGELRIRQLRQKAEESLGQQFDIRQFHDVVLGSGSVPLDVLEANVLHYVEQEGSGGVDR